MEAIYGQAYFLSPVFTHVSSHPFFHCRYNKRDVDFPSLREYNDYLEQVEDIGMIIAPKGLIRQNNSKEESLMGISHAWISVLLC